MQKSGRSGRNDTCHTQYNQSGIDAYDHAIIFMDPRHQGIAQLLQCRYFL